MPSRVMPPAPDHPHETRVRPATLADLDALVTLEHEAFATDRMSRRSVTVSSAGPMSMDDQRRPM